MAQESIESPRGIVEIVYEGVFEGRCEGTLDHVGKLTGECRVERIMGSAPQDASFAEPMTLAGTVRSDVAGAYFDGSIHDDITFEGRGNSAGAAGSWRFASPSGWQDGGRWRAVVRRN